MAVKRNGLGKGLDSLIPNKTVKTTEKQANKTQKEKVKVEKSGETIVKITQVEPNSEQPRKDFDEDALLELADSIKQFGVLQPLLVQKKNDYYEIIAGERRWRAAKIANLKEVPVVIKDYTKQEVMEIALIENIQREDLNPIEEAEAYDSLIKEFHLKQDEIAEKVSKSRVAITNALRLLKLDERVRTMLVEDKLKSGHARALLAIENNDLQYETAVQVFDQKLSVRETEKLVKKILLPKAEKKEDEKNNDEQMKTIYQNFEEKLKMIMGTKVNINHGKKGKGKIEIEYYSPDEFDRIMELMTKIADKN